MTGDFIVPQQSPLMAIDTPLNEHGDVFQCSIHEGWPR